MIKLNKLQKLIILTIALISLSGCATVQNYENNLKSWNGYPEASLISSWGIPNREYLAGDTKFIEYNHTRTMYIPGTNPSYQTSIYGNTVYTVPYGGSSGYTVRLYCNTTFIIKNGVITGYRFDGNSCRAY